MPPYKISPECQSKSARTAVWGQWFRKGSDTSATGRTPKCGNNTWDNNEGLKVTGLPLNMVINRDVFSVEFYHKGLLFGKCTNSDTNIQTLNSSYRSRV